MPWYGFALITALAIALVGVLQKRTLQNEHSSEYFMLFSFFKLLMFLVIIRGGINWTVTPTQFQLLVLTGLLAGLAFYFVTKALRRLELSAVSPVLALDSGVSSLLALIFLGEKISGQQFVGLLLLLIGTYILELRRYPPGWWGETLRKPLRLFTPFRELGSTPGGIFALLSLLFFAASAVVDRAVLPHVAVTTYLAYVLPSITVVSIITLVSTRTKLTILNRRGSVLLLPIFLTAGIHLVSNFTQAKATALMAVGLVLALKRLSSLMDVLMSGKIFHEHGIAQKAWASVIMLIGVFLVVVS